MNNLPIFKDLQKKLIQEFRYVSNQISTNISSSSLSFPLIHSKLAILSQTANKHLIQKDYQLIEKVNKRIQELNGLFEKVKRGNNNNVFPVGFLNDFLMKIITFDYISTNTDKIFDNKKSELIKLLQTLVNEKVEIETFSGKISGVLSYLEKDYVIVGNTTLVPYQRIKKAKEVIKEGV